MTAFTDGLLQVQFVPHGSKDFVRYSFLDQCKDEYYRPVSEKDIKRYPQQWAAYTAARPRETDAGTLLTKLPGIDDATAVLIRMKGPANVEALATLDDYAATGLGPQGIQWRDTARLYLSAQRSKEPAQSSLNKTKVA